MDQLNTDGVSLVIFSQLQERRSELAIFLRRLPARSMPISPCHQNGPYHDKYENEISAHNESPMAAVNADDGLGRVTANRRRGK